MKRLAAAFLLLALIFTTTACSLATPSDTDIENSTSITTKAISDDKEEIYNSVSKLIDHDILHEEEYHRLYNFISETTGYFFQFKLFGSENRLIYLLKTEDGGKTWAAEDIQSAPSMGWRERITCAKMLDESVGIVSGSFWADANFSDHTYVTADGGKTWSKVVLPKDAPYVYSENSSNLVTYLEGEAYDLSQENGVYFLQVRAYTFDPNSVLGYECLRFSSTDLKSWTYIAP